MELSEMFAALRRHWWVPVLTLVLAGAAGFALPSDDTVRSTGLLVVGADPTLVGEGARFSAVDEIDSELIFTFTDVVDGGESVAAAAEAAGVDPGDVTVDATPGQQAKTVQVAVEGDDADDVQAMAAAVMDEGTTRFLSLYDIFQVQVIDEAGSAVATGPSSVKVAGVAGALGLAVGIALVLAVAMVTRWRAGPTAATDTP